MYQKLTFTWMIGNRGRTPTKSYETVKTFSDDINIAFRFYRCTNTALTKGKSIHSQNLILNIKRKYKNLNGKKHTGTQRLNEVQVYINI